MQGIGLVDFVLWFAGLVIGILYCLGLFMIARTPSKSNFKIARRCFILCGFILLGADIVWTLTTDRSLGVRMLVSGILGAVAFIGVTESLRLVKQQEDELEKKVSIEDKKPTYSMDNISNNRGIITQGQIGSNTVINTPVPRTLDKAKKDGIILRLSSKSKPILIYYLAGSKEREDFAKEIANFLYSQGYKINAIMALTTAGSPIGIEVDDRSPQMAVITVGENQ